MRGVVSGIFLDRWGICATYEARKVWTTASEAVSLEMFPPWGRAPLENLLEVDALRQPLSFPVIHVVIL